ncbi:MAG: hypothetical protein J7604_22700 [Sporocytophaga sp.]|uniref:hypothetical protein n=1 Tax=Sporocytophaga sp. TaxID=2231183 RepID=UPI001B28FDBD|nr:hypothetical protein [Sporocytophaga sp.]MBO9703042.1 hypothetical protein [Sporocytophaga sp.]
MNYTQIPQFEIALFKDVINEESETLNGSGIEENLEVDSSQYKFYCETKLGDKIVLIGYILGGNGIFT